MKKLYVVQRSGVYDQGISGIFTSYKKAKERKESAKKEEIDDYYTFEIKEYIVNQPINLVNT